jgi:Uma2 family endonuclease
MAHYETMYGLELRTMATKSYLTVEEFEELARLPENADKRLEFIGGEIVEVVTNNYASEIAATILAEIKIFAKRNNLGRVTGADGGYMVVGERYMPDVAFIARERQPEPSHATWNPKAPNLAVEVVSPSDTPRDITDKVVNYLAAGTVVWVIYPDKQQAKVFEPGQPTRTLTIDDILDGGNVLPGFKLALSEIFAV